MKFLILKVEFNIQIIKDKVFVWSDHSTKMKDQILRVVSEYNQKTSPLSALRSNHVLKSPQEIRQIVISPLRIESKRMTSAFIQVYYIINDYQVQSFQVENSNINEDKKIKKQQEFQILKNIIFKKFK
ncbi:unnamed protein product [Paramecium sonneborni]|uniref:Uncharacterized protein n=1 Tax=Paramecium sonneborni TaxID=65129 RepID=A0A8S1QAL5_9CILI|nr:unnamed protein product [Paramecium sonneborni]